MAGGAAAEVEAAGVVTPAAGVAVGRAHEQQDLGAVGDLHPGHFDGPGRGAEEGLDGRLAAQGLLERRPGQAGVGVEEGVLVGVGGQAPQRVAADFEVAPPEIALPVKKRGGGAARRIG